jgi:transcriptional regulator with XRE-family HTH domain
VARPKTDAYQFKLPLSAQGVQFPAARASFLQNARLFEDLILLESKIYFSHPDQFNDPFDVAPVVKHGCDPNDPAYRKEIEDAELAAHQDAGLTDEQIAELRKSEGVTLERLAALAGADLRLKLRDAQRILRLTADRRHPPQWAHYANGHQGVCIHFRCQPESWFGVARKVHYRKDWLPILIPLERQSDDEIVDCLVFSKARFWRYEKEYRMFANHSDSGPIQLRRDFGYFAASDVTGITIGARMSEADQQDLFGIRNHRRQAIDVWECVPDEETFSPCPRTGYARAGSDAPINRRQTGRNVSPARAARRD